MSRSLENPAPFIVASLRQGCPMPSHRSPRHENVRAASDFGDTAPDAGIGAFRPSPSQGLRAGAGILIPSRRAGMEGVGMEAGMESILHPKARGWMRGWNPPSIPKGTDSRCHPNRKGRKHPSLSILFGMVGGWRALGTEAAKCIRPRDGGAGPSLWRHLCGRDGREGWTAVCCVAQGSCPIIRFSFHHQLPTVGTSARKSVLGSNDFPSINLSGGRYISLRFEQESPGSGVLSFFHHRNPVRGAWA